MSTQKGFDSNIGAGTGLATLSVPQDFLKRVKRAIERLAIDGIELWRPYVADEIKRYFDVVISGSSIGCDNEMCGHNSHDPASPTIKLIPKRGKIITLGYIEYGEIKYIYYALLLQNKTLYFKVTQEPFYHDGIHEVTKNEIPDFLLALNRGE